MQLPDLFFVMFFFKKYHLADHLYTFATGVLHLIFLLYIPGTAFWQCDVFKHRFDMHKPSVFLVIHNR